MEKRKKSFEEKRFDEVLRRLRQVPRFEGEKTAEEIFLEGKLPCLVRLGRSCQKEKVKIAVSDAASFGLKPRHSELREPFLILAEERADKSLRKMTFTVGPHPPRWNKEMMFLTVSALSGLHRGFGKLCSEEVFDFLERAQTITEGA